MSIFRLIPTTERAPVVPVARTGGRKAAVVKGWSRALELRDKETEGHARRVAAATVSLARAMGADAESRRHLHWGALLHDIGKIGVPDSILHKPGPLSAEEWAVMRRHPEHAHAILAPISFLRCALDIPYCHHERWDGTGYPRGLAGEEIPLGARIFAVVDVWDALLSQRPYRAAWDEPQVLAEIEAGAGTHFDPRVVDAFLELRSKLRARTPSHAAVPVRRLRGAMRAG